jgi:hypothetical protein
MLAQHCSLLLLQVIEQAAKAGPAGARYMLSCLH